MTSSSRFPNTSLNRFKIIEELQIENLKQQFPCEYPVNPHMKDFNARLQTFDQRWSSQKVNATPQHIAEAGFYFLGNFYKMIL